MKRFCLGIAIGMGWAGTGCQSPPPAPATGPMDAAEINRIFSAGRSPGDFFIHSHRAADNRPFFTGQNRLPPGERAVLLFETPAHSLLPVIRGRSASGAEFFLLTDTTSRENWTNFEHRTLLGFEPIGPIPFGALPAHVSDDIPGYLCVLPEMTLDRMTISSVLLYARAVRGGFWPLHRHADARAAIAVMGVDFLRGFAYVTWDYSSRLMTFSSTLPYEPDREAVLAELPIEFDPDLGAIEIPWVMDGQEGSAIFDSAGDYEVAFDNAPLDLIRQIGLQDLIFRRVRAIAPQKAGLQPIPIPYLGNALLRRYRVTLDNRRNALWIEAAAEPSLFETGPADEALPEANPDGE